MYCELKSRTRSMRLHLEEHRLLPYGEWHPNYMCIGLHCLQLDKFRDRNSQILLLVNRKHCSLNMGHRTCRNCCHANCLHIPNISHRYCDQNIRIVLRNYILLLNYRLIHRNTYTMADVNASITHAAHCRSVVVVPLCVIS
jgi:hypothetical protein